MEKETQQEKKLRESLSYINKTIDLEDLIKIKIKQMKSLFDYSFVVGIINEFMVSYAATVANKEYGLNINDYKYFNPLKTYIKVNYNYENIKYLTCISAIVGFIFSLIISIFYERFVLFPLTIISIIGLFAGLILDKKTMDKLAVDEIKRTLIENQRIIISHYEKMINKMIKNNIKELTFGDDKEEVYRADFIDYINIEKLKLDENIKKIGKYAFISQTSLKEIYIHKTLKIIEENAFKDCYKLERVYYNGTIEEWLNIKLENNYSNPMCKAKDLYILNKNNEYKLLESLKIENDSIFENNVLNLLGENISQLYLSNKITSIKENAFREFSKLKKVYYNGTIEEWCNIVFENQYSNPMSMAKEFYILNSKNEYELLEELSIPSKVKNINEYQFYNFQILKKINLSENVMEITNSAFINCKNIKFLNVPLKYVNLFEELINNKIREIEINDGVNFDENNKILSSQLEKITLPSTLQKISSIFFSNITIVKEIYINLELNEIIDKDILESLKLIKNKFKKIYCVGKNSIWENITNELYACSITKKNWPEFISKGVLNIAEYVKKIDDNVFEKSQIKKIIMEEGITNIGEFAFNKCKILEEIYISKSILEIQKGAFMECNYIKAVYYNATIEDWCKIIFISKTSNPMYYSEKFYCKKNENFGEISSLVLDFDITEIGDFQFCGMNSLEKLVIPSNIKKIGCSTFYKCVNLARIEISSSVEEIKADAFELCEKIEEVYYDGTIEDWCRIKFENHTSNPMYFTNKFYYKNKDNEYQLLDEGLVITNKIKRINAYQFSGYKNISLLDLSFKIDSFDENAFVECDNLKRLICNTENISLLNDNENLCGRVKELEIVSDNNVMNINLNFENISKVILSKEIINYDNEIFKNCNHIEEVYYKGTIEDWCNITFKYSSSNPLYKKSDLFVQDENREWMKISEINNLGNVINLGDYQFYNCNSIKKIDINENIKSIGISCFEGCANLKEVKLTKLIKGIGKDAFAECGIIEKVYMPKLFFNISNDDEKEYILIEESKCVILNNHIYQVEYINGLRKYKHYKKENSSKIIIDGKNFYKVIKEKDNNQYEYFSGTKIEQLYYLGMYEEFCKHKMVFQDTYANKISNLYFLKNDSWITEEEIIKDNISNSIGKIFKLKNENNYQKINLSIKDCFFSILKSSVLYAKKQTNDNKDWKIFITIHRYEEEISNEKILNLINDVIIEIKKKYAFLMIRSQLYFSTILFNEDSIIKNIYKYDSNYNVVLLDENDFSEKNKEVVYSVENIEEELILIENKNKDAIDCVKAYNGELEIYDWTQEKLDSMYSLIDKGFEVQEKTRILIEGPARSGKTIIVFQLLNKYKEFKFLLMNYYFYIAIKDAFNALDKEFPSNRIYHHDLTSGREVGCGTYKGDYYNDYTASFKFNLDYVIVDEAQRLTNLPGKMGYKRYFAGFDGLDIIIKKPNISIFLGDDLQRLNPKHRSGFDEIKTKLDRNNLIYYNYHFNESIGIPSNILNSIKYILFNDDIYKEDISSYSIELQNNAGDFKNNFDNENTNSKHYSYIASNDGDIPYNMKVLGLTIFPKEKKSENYFLNKETQGRYVYSAYEMISREVEAMYLIIPNYITYSKDKGIYDKSYDGLSREFLLNHLYVNMTRGTKKLVIYTEDYYLYEYLRNKINEISLNEIVKIDKRVFEEQKINYVLNSSDKSSAQKLEDELKKHNFKGFIHAGDYKSIFKALSQDKLLSRNDAKGLFIDIADQDVIVRTNEFVKSKVRFYYKENTPTLYHFNRTSNELVTLIFDFSLVNEYTVYFADGNAASKHTKFYGLIEDAINIDWKRVFERGPIYDDFGKYDIIRKRNAELLVCGPVNISKYLKKIVVKTKELKEKIENDFPQYKNITYVDLHYYE